MKKLLAFVVLLSGATYKESHAMQFPLIRTVLGLTSGAVSASSGYIGYKMLNPKDDSSVGTVVIAPIPLAISAVTGIGSLLLLKSAKNAVTNKSMIQMISPLFKNIKNLW